MRSRSSRGSDSSSEKEGSGRALVACMSGAVGVGVGRAAPCEGLRRRAGRLGECGWGGASIMVASDRELLLDDERDRDGVELRDAIFGQARR